MTGKKLTRREARENVFLTVFSDTFVPETEREENEELPLDDYGQKLLNDIRIYQSELDGVIEAHLKGWALRRLPRVSLAALRVALAEMLYSTEPTEAVAINEAVELVKKYGAENDYQFVNGLLGTVARERGTGNAPAESC